jgi:aconitate hydratase
VARRGSPDPVFTDTLELDLGTSCPSLAGPKRPQDRVPLLEAIAAGSPRWPARKNRRDGDAAPVEGKNYDSATATW